MKRHLLNLKEGVFSYKYLGLVCLIGILWLPQTKIFGYTHNIIKLDQGHADDLDTAIFTKGVFHRLQGTVGTHRVIMQLQIALGDNQSCVGLYYYNDRPQLLELRQAAIATSDTIQLEEYDFGKQNDSAKAIIRLWPASKGFAGIRIAHQETNPIQLAYNYDNSSLRFDVNAYSDSILAFPGNAKSPVAKIELTFPAALGNSDEAMYINGRVRKLITNYSEQSSGDLHKLAKAEILSYLNGYQKDLRGQENTVKDGASYNYSSFSLLEILFDKAGYVIISDFNYDYSGGVHGNYGTLLHVYDSKNKKELRLNDILSVDSAALQNVVEKYFRKQYGLAPNGALNSILFDDYLAANHNFYFTDKGIGFLYNPYEVASYAQGQIDVFVPFEALLPYLDKDFLRRLGYTVR